jgi:2,4-dienoyl-CoA reductase-like NADH-dependent reductase (Old Yellow Enzyme family)
MADLRSELNIKNLHLRNRLVLPPMATEATAGDGLVTERLLRYYAEKAAGAFLGLVITEHCYIMPEGKASPGQVSAASDEAIPGLRQLTDTLHGCGVPCVCQINHAGGRAKQSVTGLPSAAPSAVWADGTRFSDRELSKADILAVVEAFAAAARRAKDAGYDAVEIHSAHGYLLNQFYSPLTNHRTDEYGGSLENRMRIHREVLQAVRQRIVKAPVISVRLGGCDYMEGGNSIQDSAAAAKILEENCADMISVSGGMCRYIREGHEEPGYFSDMSSEIKKAVSIPVMLTGGVKEAADAERLLREDAADLIGIGRELLKDTKWAVRALETIRHNL